MTNLYSSEPLSNLSDSSFVILGQGSLTPEVNDDSGDTNKNSNLSFPTNNETPFPVFETSSDSKFHRKLSGQSILSEEGLQKKINELMKENYQLKEILSQNNLAIKSQLDTFFLWHQEVLKTHESHKEKFLETKDLILKLRSENLSLKKQLEDSLVGASFATISDINPQVDKKPEELENLKKMVKEFQKMYEDVTKENNDLSMKNLLLKEELKASENEIFKLNSKLEDLKRDNIYFKKKSEESRKNSLTKMPSSSLLNIEDLQIPNLLVQLDEEKSKVLKLTDELKKMKSSISEPSESKLSTTEQLNKFIDKLDDMNVSLDLQSQRFNSLQGWVSLAEENVKERKKFEGAECNLISEINDLKCHLNLEENVSRKKQESLQELKKQFARLLDDYKTLQSQLNFMNDKEKNIEKYKKEIATFSANLNLKDNELKLKQEECDNLKKEIDKINSEKIVLKSKVDVYEKTLKEQVARKKLVEEMAEENRYLQSIVKDLGYTTATQRKNFEATLEDSSGDKNVCTCPQCFLKFSDAQTLEKHFILCSSISLYP